MLQIEELSTGSEKINKQFLEGQAQQQKTH